MSNAIASLMSDSRVSLLVGIAARGVIVAVLGFITLFLMARRASASARYLVMLVCMAGLLVLPLLSVVTPVWRVPVLPAPASIGVSPDGGLPGDRGASVLLREGGTTSATPPAMGRGMIAPFRAPSNFAPPARSLSIAPAEAILLVWLSGCALCAGWLALGRFRLGRLARRCVRVTSGPLNARIQELAARSEVRASIRVLQGTREDDAFMTPMTWGWLRPVLLLPGGVLDEWPADRLQAVLLHEMAHIARRDWLTRCVAQLACCLYWFNPLVWRMASAMEREAEQACDDRVLLFGVQPADYAGHLLDVVKSLRMLHGAVLRGGAQTMCAPRSNVQVRLLAILAADRNRAQPTRRAGVLALILSAMVCAPLAALHLARAAQPAHRANAPAPPAADLDVRAAAWSWRGDWAKAAQEADAILKDAGSSRSRRANACWIKFESAWWSDDRAQSERNYRLFAKFARKHPEDAVARENLKIANRYRALPPPRTLSNAQILTIIRARFQARSFADALHFTRYLLNRPDVSARMRAEALVLGYGAARYWGYQDTQELLHQQFRSEVKRLARDERRRWEENWDDATQQIRPRDADNRANPVSGVVWENVKLEGPTNLDFQSGLTGWVLDAEQGTGRDYRIGVDPHGALGGAAAFLEAPGSRSTGEAGLSQTCRADAFRGKRIRFSALVRTSGASGGADFYLHLDAPDRVRTWNGLDNPILGTSDWKRYEYVAEVPQNIEGFIFGVDLQGRGKVWVRDVRLEVVDQNVPLSQVSNDFPI